MIRFDSRDKKPHVHGLAVLTAVAGAIVAAMFGAGAQDVAVALVIDAYLLLTLVYLIAAFLRQLEYNLYSYNTILYSGFAVLIATTLLLHINVTLIFIRTPGVCRPRETLEMLMLSGMAYIFLSFPFVLAFSIALCISNLSLLKHEGKSFKNVQGLLLSAALVLGSLVLIDFNFFIDWFGGSLLLHDLLGNVFTAVYVYFESMLIGTIIADAIAARHEPALDRDYVVILGCRMRRDGTPTPLLRGRIDRAIAFADKQKAAGGKEVVFVTSGGKGADEPLSESACMKNYLLQQGIPEERIVEEDQSKNTFQNMAFSKALIEARTEGAKVAFSTTNYHVFRSGVYARRNKLRAAGMGAKTKWYYWPNAAVREFIGLLSKHQRKQIFVLGGMILVYVLLTCATYAYPL